MRTIWKFRVPIGGDTLVPMPRNATVIDVRVQRATPCFWAVVETDEPTVPRVFRWVATGDFIDDVSEYLGTIQSPDETLVFHLFELTR